MMRSRQQWIVRHIYMENAVFAQHGRRVVCACKAGSIYLVLTASLPLLFVYSHCICVDARPPDRVWREKVTTAGEIKGEQSGEFVPVLALDCRCETPRHDFGTCLVVRGSLCFLFPGGDQPPFLSSGDVENMKRNALKKEVVEAQASARSPLGKYASHSTTMLTRNPQISSIPRGEVLTDVKLVPLGHSAWEIPISAPAFLFEIDFSSMTNLQTQR